MCNYRMNLKSPLGLSCFNRQPWPPCLLIYTMPYLLALLMICFLFTSVSELECVHEQALYSVCVHARTRV